MRSTSIPAALALTLALALWSSVRPRRKTPLIRRHAPPPNPSQFDFWIGDWNVTLPNGKYAGTNRIEPILTGCVLRESWSGARGMHGTSYNIYDTAHRRWHQTWVDDGGNLLQLDGAFQDGKMVLIGEQKSDSATTLRGSPGRRRARKCGRSGTPRTDGGKTWSVVFDGTYRKKT